MILLEIAFGLAALAWCAGSFMVWYTQDRGIFPGDGAPFGAHPELKVLGGEALSAERDGQKLRWYFFPAEGAKAAALLFHGNRDGAFERLDFVEALKPLGVSVALAEFPGYAGEPGPTSEWAVLRNALAMHDEVAARTAGLPLFVMGESLGTGPATYVASLRRPRGLILSTPYTSMADVAKFRYPWVPIHRLIRHPFKATLWAPHVQCPVLALHGTADQTVPYAMGQAESKRFSRLERFETVEGAGHADLRGFNHGQFWKACGAFIVTHAADA
jgi:alpha-beta hydrolase superfamily lysophospholipase